MTDHNHAGGCVACNELLARETAARIAAEEASRAKDNFFLTLSHELRGPLNAITCWAHILRTTSVNEETTSRAIETIERNAWAQARLINDMFQMAQVIGGKIRLERCAVDLATLVAESAEDLRPLANGRDIRVQTESAVGTISADPDRLRQVVGNLLQNALKFTPEGGHITVRLGSDASSATIAVQDTGRGIRPDVLPHVFERLWQSGETPTGAAGLGLGLAIVRQLVELHGGTIAATSEGESHGATFTVRLPTAPHRRIHPDRARKPPSRTSARRRVQRAGPLPG